MIPCWAEEGLAVKEGGLPNYAVESIIDLGSFVYR